MKIPKKLKIGGHQFLINIKNNGFEKYLEPTKDEPNRKAGKTWLGGELILINKELSPQQQEESLIHETLHHILFRMGESELCINEKFIQGLASWLHSFLKDNNLLRK